MRRPYSNCPRLAEAHRRGADRWRGRASPIAARQGLGKAGRSGRPPLGLAVPLIFPPRRTAPRGPSPAAMARRKPRPALPRATSAAGARDLPHRAEGPDTGALIAHTELLQPSNHCGHGRGDTAAAGAAEQHADLGVVLDVVGQGDAGFGTSHVRTEGAGANPRLIGQKPRPVSRRRVSRRRRRRPRPPGHPQPFLCRRPGPSPRRLRHNAAPGLGTPCRRAGDRRW
jgi:hypothetical protein